MPSTHATALTARGEVPNLAQATALAAPTTSLTSAALTTTAVDSAAADSVQPEQSPLPPSLTSSAPTAGHSKAPPLARTHTARPAAATGSSPNVTTTTPRVAAPAAKPEPRALDLIAPY
ncbi:MAG TPA: hypothetical protein VK745_04530 [Polyangiaceae bacterium]|nr:hypothetical protein [Polyangiaceae bacterium]